MSNPVALVEGEKTLIVDGDTRLRRLLERPLGEQGYRVRAMESTEQMDRLLSHELFQLVVLDLVLPGKDGLTAYYHLHEQNNQMPIIMLTTKGDEGNCIQGLELGADDYLAKPFDPRELLVRTKAVLRRRAPSVPDAPAGADGVVIFGGYQLFLATHELKKGDGVRMLTTDEFVMPGALVQHARESLVRNKLMDLARDRKQDTLERSIDMQISCLRWLIEPDPFKPRCAQAVWGVGYMLVSGGNARKA